MRKTEESKCFPKEDKKTNRSPPGLNTNWPELLQIVCEVSSQTTIIVLTDIFNLLVSRHTDAKKWLVHVAST